MQRHNDVKDRKHANGMNNYKWQEKSKEQRGAMSLNSNYTLFRLQYGFEHAAFIKHSPDCDDDVSHIK